ncbi:MAG: tetratricopeptide repeat protein [Bacteroidales bacterium]|nr:tetratricopeptide repeat protein [Bacteroidales bacterium]
MKRKKLIILLLSILLSSFLYGQSSEIDSLRNIISKTKIDSVKVNSLNELGQKLTKVDLDNAMDTIDLSIEIAKKSEFIKGLALGYKIKGIIFYYQGQVDTGLTYFYKSLDIYESNDYVSEAAKMYNNIGIIQKSKGNIQEAITSYLKAIELLKQTNDKATMVTVSINASNVFYNIGNYQRALEFNHNALSIINEMENKTIADSIQIGHIYKSIANIQTDQKNWKEADSNYLLALKIYEKVNSLSDIGDIYLNLGVVQVEQDSFINAKNFYLKALPYYQNKNKIATAMLNIGEVYINIPNFDSSKFYLYEALKLNTEIGDNRGIALAYSTLGKLFNKQKKYTEAIKNLKIALDTAKKVGDIKIIFGVSEELYKSYKETGNFEKALEMHELFKTMNDSIFNTNNEKSLTQMSMTFEFEKEQEQTELRYQEELKRQKIIRNFSFAVLFLVILVLISVFSSLRTKKRKNEELKKKNAEILQQNEEIETQKEEIEAQRDEIEEKSKEVEKQRDIAIQRGDEIDYQKKEIEASIRYAYRIQQAIIPDLEPLKNNFSDHFVFFRPRDIVSGDFYWVAQKGNKTIVVAADCTGHGVPGAFMSMLGVSFLNQIISGLDDIQSNIILNQLRQMVMTALKQDNEIADSSKDGMDIALVVHDKNTNKVQYSGAYNSMYIISQRDVNCENSAKPIRLFKSNNSDKKLCEVRADRMPIGVFIIETDDFAENTIQLEKGDKFYLFSDGYPDLYNRKDETKFTTKRFKETLIDSSDLSMSKQVEKLEKIYLDWCGEYKQVDDIILIGVEI